MASTGSRARGKGSVPSKTRGMKTAPKAQRTAAKKKKVSAVPAGYHTVTPYLVCRNAAGALEFYTKAFGARATVRMAGPGGKLAHGEMRIGDSIVMLGEEEPERGATAPETVGGTAVSVFLYVPNVDKVFARAIAAGARAEMPPTNMFWGDRYAKLQDPFGHKWGLATHIEDVPGREMARRSREFMARQAETAGA